MEFIHIFTGYEIASHKLDLMQYLIWPYAPSPSSRYYWFFLFSHWFEILSITPLIWNVIVTTMFLRNIWIFLFFFFVWLPEIIFSILWVFRGLRSISNVYWICVCLTISLYFIALQMIFYHIFVVEDLTNLPNIFLRRMDKCWSVFDIDWVIIVKIRAMHAHIMWKKWNSTLKV